MKADPRFLNQPMLFWANIRAISEAISCTDRATRQICIPVLLDMQQAMSSIGLADTHLVDLEGQPTILAQTLLSYFEHRAQTLNETVQGLLMDAQDAGNLYQRLCETYQPRRLPPMNKQTGSKKSVAYLTAMVNLLIESTLEELGELDLDCDYDPRVLTTATRHGAPLRTLARRVDGAFPSTVNPIAIWEIKEYYHTTTFGSRVADGVYETLLDGLELEELRVSEQYRHKALLDYRLALYLVDYGEVLSVSYR